MLSPNYIATAVRLLEETGAHNVGGIMHAEGENAWEQAVAAAMTSRIGVGNAAFHTGGEAGPAETVYLGVFRREALERQGGYNEEFIRAQDWELNFRIREAGGLIWFSPELRVQYRPRPTVRALAKQYKDYGRWRHVVARYQQGSINLRYLAPPVALCAIAAGLVVGAALTPLGFAVPGGYLAAILLGSVPARAGACRGRPGCRSPSRSPPCTCPGASAPDQPRALARKVIASRRPAVVPPRADTAHRRDTTRARRTDTAAGPSSCRARVSSRRPSGTPRRRPCSPSGRPAGVRAVRQVAGLRLGLLVRGAFAPVRSDHQRQALGPGVRPDRGTRQAERLGHRQGIGAALVAFRLRVLHHGVLARLGAAGSRRLREALCPAAPPPGRWPGRGRRLPGCRRCR